MDYNDWRNFVNVIGKAKIACSNSGQEVKDHFVEVTKKVKIGSEAERGIEDIKKLERKVKEDEELIGNRSKKITIKALKPSPLPVSLSRL